MPLEPLPIAEEVAEPKRQRVFSVSYELLAQVLLLPPGTKIVDVSGQLRFFSGEVSFKVEHPAFDPVPAGYAIPECRPMFSEVRTPKFVGWEPR